MSEDNIMELNNLNCRLCFQYFPQVVVIEKQLKDMIVKCLPSIEPFISAEHYLCLKCFTKLQTSFDFINMCSKALEHFETNIQTNVNNYVKEINLNNDGKEPSLSDKNTIDRVNKYPEKKCDKSITTDQIIEVNNSSLTQTDKSINNSGVDKDKALQNISYCLNDGKHIDYTDNMIEELLQDFNLILEENEFISRYSIKDTNKNDFENSLNNQKENIHNTEALNNVRDLNLDEFIVKDTSKNKSENISLENIDKATLNDDEFLNLNDKQKENSNVRENVIKRQNVMKNVYLGDNEFNIDEILTKQSMSFTSDINIPELESYHYNAESELNTFDDVVLSKDLFELELESDPKVTQESLLKSHEITKESLLESNKKSVQENVSENTETENSLEGSKNVMQENLLDRSERILQETLRKSTEKVIQENAFEASEIVTQTKLLRSSEQIIEDNLLERAKKVIQKNLLESHEKIIEENLLESTGKVNQENLAMKESHVEKYLNCETCNENLKDKYLLNDHLDKKHPYCCKICNTRMNTKEKYTAHMSTHKKHSKPEAEILNELTGDVKQPRPTINNQIKPEKFICHVCGKTVYNMEIHLKLHEKVSCQQCGLKMTKKSLKKHIDDLHNPPKYVCEKCGKLFKKNEHLVRHMSNIHSEIKLKKLKCDICKDKLFSNSQILDRHILTQHRSSEMHKCINCKAMFLQKASYDKHISRNICFKSCNICNKVFSNRGTLYYHMKTHNKDNLELSCHVCGKMFKHIQLLKEHQRTNGHKYKCSFCNTVLSTRPSFANHKKLHKHEKPHFCNLCRARYYTADELKEHYEKHNTGKYQCEKCGDSFGRNYLLQAHFKVVH